MEVTCNGHAVEDTASQEVQRTEEEEEKDEEDQQKANILNASTEGRDLPVNATYPEYNGKGPSDPHNPGTDGKQGRELGKEREMEECKRPEKEMETEVMPGIEEEERNG